MPRRKLGERILGPYEHGQQWRVICIAEDGTKAREHFATEAKAAKYIELLRAALAVSNLTVSDAMEEYKKALRFKGNKPTSIDSTEWAVAKLLPMDELLDSVTPEICLENYEAITSKLAVASHRNALAQTKTFLTWCVKQKYIKANPAEAIEGTGRRNHGKPQIRTKDARTWVTKAMELANEGDVGAVAAMITLGSGLRASEVCNIRGRDIDDTFGPGDTLWIDDSKTKAGLREVEVPPELSPFLLELARTSGPDGKIFGNHWRDWPRLQVHRICRLVGIAEVSAHSMRGFYASRKLRDGEALEDVARDIGHEEGSTTTRSYASRGSTSGTNARGFSRLAQAFPKKPIETNGEPQPEGK